MRKDTLEKLSDLFFSFGLILAGPVLLFVGSVSFYSSHDLSIVNQASASTISPLRATTAGDVAAILPNNRPTIPLARNTENYEQDFTAASALVVDSKSKEILFSREPKQVRSLASITKLMSAMVLLDLPLDWSATTTILDSDVNSDQHVKAGEVFTNQDLWQAALVGSSNTAVKALVRVSGLQPEEFVTLMNDKAKRLGLESLTFVEPTGLSEGNVGHAVDVASLLRQALLFDKIYSSLQISEHYVRPLNKKKLRQVWSTNWLVTNWIPSDYRSGQVIGKTGYIEESGYNLAVSLASSNQDRVIVVILGSGSNENRFTEARDLADWIFQHYLWPTQAGYDDLVE